MNGCLWGEAFLRSTQDEREPYSQMKSAVLPCRMRMEFRSRSCASLDSIRESDRESWLALLASVAKSAARSAFDVNWEPNWPHRAKAPRTVAR